MEGAQREIAAEAAAESGDALAINSVVVGDPFDRGEGVVHGHAVAAVAEGIPMCEAEARPTAVVQADDDETKFGQHLGLILK